MNRRATLLVVVAMVLGVAVGFLLSRTLDPTQVKTVGGYFSMATDVFLRLIKMIIGPLVSSTLVVGITHMEDSAAVGRVGVKTIGWFILASLVSLTIGLIMVHLFQPGVGLGLPLPPENAATGVEATAFTLKDFITHLVPTSIFDAMARNEILQIVVFSVFVGTAIAALDNRAPQLVQLAELIAQVMLKITGYVMALAPLAIFAALANTVATHGMAILLTYVKFVGGFYLSLALLWGLLLLVAFLIVGRRVGNLVAQIRAPIMLAFSTASSEAAYPRTLEGLQRFGVSRKIVSFVLPLGYSFNLDGSMMYCTFATLFIAQAYGIQMTIAQQVVMLLLLMVTSKGMAGVPRASTVVIYATLAFFSLPLQGILLIVAVDYFLDMGRSATNVVGNSVASVLVGKWEGQLGEQSTLPEAAE
ncbi:MAG TPA: dicarboxylate/amino acid:cation symporter [Caulobacteraceae bacterium]|nr:dicarboxylate/amino acid:cation symporter [Caulobacteraceae bacterium]